MTAPQSSSSLPFRTETFTANVEGRPTEFALTGYADRLLVVASQLGSLGSILAAEKETVLGGGSTYRVDTLLGRRDEPLAELCARQLAERLCDAGCDRPLLLCLALERATLTKAAVQQVVQQVLEHPVW
ncbi:Proteasome assembly chaperone 3 [Chlorella sorokiniana]|uniref:Proteasome assembly chaperone 3 n=1 Tax=Chlorella sorokiniana TaxID=3076 RepID=A0A2P6U586_CHLSO|nr:Proteasome assembly chaperone 3 [Chlorella sorokiniana]|eukprot:PRW61483.1 Proteasome assembly chaperone 3 [Chlorella sorokiniana]